MRLIDIVNGPWAITPDMLGEIQEIYRAHVRGPKIDIPAVEARLGRPLKNETKNYQVIDGVAVLEASGPIARRMNLFMEISGGTSTELLRRDFNQAMDDPTVKGIVLVLNSPGGTVDGTQELAETIYARRGEKPILSLAEGMMASAACWIGAAADGIFISDETAMTGSIGVVAAHVDVSKAEEKAGIKTTEISAGRYKRIASNYEPLTTEGRADIQAKIDAIYSVFVDNMAKYRGTSAEDVLERMADGRVFVGRQAIEAGLVDGVSTLEALIAKINQHQSPAGVARATSKGDPTMTIEEFRAQHPELFAQIEAAARQGYISAIDLQGQIEAAVAGERARIQAVESQLIPGHEALIATLKFDGKTTGDQAAAAVVAAEKGTRTAALAALEKDTPPVVAAAEGDGGSDVNAPIEERTKAQWDKSPELRAEFGKYEAFLAYSKKAEAGGVRILGKK
jgi:signal peptide peptidase SppA